MALYELLEKEVARRKGTMTVEGKAITVQLPNGNFISTPGFWTHQQGRAIFLRNVKSCLDFVRTSRIGSVAPPRKISISHLGKIAGEIRAISVAMRQEAEMISEEMDAYGAPSECAELAFKNWDKIWHEKKLKVLKKYDLTWEQYNDVIHERIIINFRLYSDLL